MTGKNLDNRYGLEIYENDFIARWMVFPDLDPEPPEATLSPEDVEQALQELGL